MCPVALICIFPNLWLLPLGLPQVGRFFTLLYNCPPDREAFRNRKLVGMASLPFHRHAILYIVVVALTQPVLCIIKMGPLRKCSLAQKAAAQPPITLNILLSRFPASSQRKLGDKSGQTGVEVESEGSVSAVA